MERAADRLSMMPKVDLHLHLDGSVKPESIVAFARESGISLPAREPDKLLPFMRADADCQSLAQYLEKFHFVCQFLQTASTLEQAAYELVEQSARQHCRYIEVRFAPQLHRERGLSLDEIIANVLRGLRRGEKDYGVKARSIVICLRGHDSAANLEVVEAAARFLGAGVVAVDLAGAEALYPAELYEAVFARARALGLPVTIHAGEAAGAASVEAAVRKLGADRIGHGIRMRENPDVVALIAERRIPLELCPVSNIQTKAAHSWAQYPIREYFEQGIAVTVNTDNLTVSDTTITKEYRILREQFHFTDEELCRIVMNGVEAAFLPADEKRDLRDRMTKQLADWLAGNA